MSSEFEYIISLILMSRFPNSHKDHGGIGVSPKNCDTRGA